MKKFCLTGFPLGHSMSPLIHTQLFKVNGIDASYELKELSSEQLAHSKELFSEYDGFNVTIPHKVAVMNFTDKLSQRAKLFGSVNTVDNKNGVLTGYNTDCIGFIKALETAGIELGGDVLLCGSGGVSRMFAFESVLAGANLTLAVRDDDIDAANQIKQEISDKLGKRISVISLAQVNRGYDLLINGTPVGMFPNVNACVLSEEIVKSCNAVFDAVYNPCETLLVKYAKQAKIKYSNGLPMLVWQAAAAQEIWFDCKFAVSQVRDVLEITERELNKR